MRRGQAVQACAMGCAVEDTGGGAPPGFAWTSLEGLRGVARGSLYGTT